MENNLLNRFYELSDENERLQLVEEIFKEYERYLDLILDNIKNKYELRSNAYLLNLMSKKKKVNIYLKNKFNKQHFDNLANDDDPKTRKNLYIFMGNYCENEYLLDLIKRLKSENINYCISSLILTLGNYKIKNIKEIMDKYLVLLDKKLENNEIEEVHYNKIKESIYKVLGKNVILDKHYFKGFFKEEILLLTCMKPLINATFSDVKKYFPNAIKKDNGIFIKTNDLERVYKIRTFYEALIVYNGSINKDFNEIKLNIKEFLKSEFLEKTHSIGDSFTYRIEFVSEKNKEEKSKIYSEINKLINDNFGNKYINNPSNYEFEIRIIDNKESYDVLYKLYTYKDKRFDYRDKDLPASINPISAAIMLKEVEKYLKENSKVLDPFCGTSTMLIERSKITKCELHGVDINKMAIEYSNINSKKGNIKINLYKQNCIEHEGYYDEIISNMPYGNRVGTHKDNEVLYKKFLNRVSRMLMDNGVAILLTSEITLMKNILKENKKLKLIKDIYTETGGLTPHLFVIKKA